MPFLVTRLFFAFLWRILLCEISGCYQSLIITKPEDIWIRVSFTYVSVQLKYLLEGKYFAVHIIHAMIQITSRLQPTCSMWVAVLKSSYFQFLLIFFYFSGSFPLLHIDWQWVIFLSRMWQKFPFSSKFQDKIACLGIVPAEKLLWLRSTMPVTNGEETTSTVVLQLLEKKS